MVIKRTFSEEDWQDTPQSVKDHVQQLEERLSRNSGNSNQPPSSDSPYNKPDKPTTKKKKGKRRKRGGQKGHKGHKQQLLEPTRTEDVMPKTCPCGRHDLAWDQAEPYYTHQVIEIPEIKAQVDHFILYQAPCSCGRMVKATVPPEQRFGYGPRLTALIGEMSGVMGISREMVRTFCQSVLSIPLSLGSVQNIIDRNSQAIASLHEEIGRLARQAPVNHVDETSSFQKGLIRWLWVLVNPKQAYYLIHPKRSKKAFKELVEDWRGSLVSDDYAAYRDWDLRQPCLSHLIRRAEALAEKKEEQVRTFGQAVLKELRLLCHWAKAPPSLNVQLEWIAQFGKFLGRHHQRRDEVGRFSRRLLAQLLSLLTFLDEEGVEPTNNRAERALRFAVLWRKRSYGTQSDKGDRWIERILSVKETCRLQSASTFQILTQAVEDFFKGHSPDTAWLLQN
jgi:transposase